MVYITIQSNNLSFRLHELIRSAFALYIESTHFSGYHFGSGYNRTKVSDRPVPTVLFTVYLL